MLKLLGAVLLTAGAAAMGFSASAQLGRRVKSLRALLGALELAERELSFRLTPIPGLLDELSRRSQGRYTLSLLYPVLYRLVKLGYVKEGGKQISPDNRVRQYYAITPTGTDYLAALRGEYQELQLAVQQIMEGEKST